MTPATKRPRWLKKGARVVALADRTWIYPVLEVQGERVLVPGRYTRGTGFFRLSSLGKTWARAPRARKGRR